MTDTPTSKGHYVFDIEADGLLFKDGNKSEISKVYCVVAIDVHTGEQHIFSDHAKEGKPLDEFKNFLNNFSCGRIWCFNSQQICYGRCNISNLITLF